MKNLVADDPLEESANPLLPNETHENSRHLSRLKFFTSSNRSGYRKRVCYVVLGLAFISVVSVSVIVYGFGKSIARKALRDSKISLKELKLTSPRTRDVTISTIMLIESSSALGASIQSTRMSILSKNQSIGSFITPDLNINHGVTKINILESLFRIDNASLWNDFSKHLVHESSVSWCLFGRVDITVHILGFPIHFRSIEFLKSVDIKGMRGLPRLEIGTMDLKNSTPRSIRMRISACLYNPSNILLDPVGIMCTNVFMLSRVKISTVQGSVSLLRRSNDVSDSICVEIGKKRYPDRKNEMLNGFSAINLSGNLIVPKSPKGLSALSTLMSQYLSGKHVTEVFATTCYPNATSIPIYNEAMKNLTVKSWLHPLKRNIIRGMKMIKSKLLIPKKHLDSNTFVNLAMNTIVTVESPLGDNSPMTIKALSMKTSLFDPCENSSTIGILFASKSSTVVHSGRVVGRSQINVSMNATLIFPKFDKGRSFGIFVKNMVRSKITELKIRGICNATANSPILGDIELDGLPINLTVGLNGMSGLSNVSLDKFRLSGDAPGRHSGEIVNARSSIWNPSIFSIDLPKMNVTLSLPVNKEFLGMVVSRSTVLFHGSNSVDLNGVLSPKCHNHHVNRPASILFSRYLRNEKSEIRANITSIEAQALWMNIALPNLVLNCKLPGSGSNFTLMSNLTIPYFDVVFDPSYGNMFKMKGNFQAIVHLPSSFSIPFHLESINMSLAFANQTSHVFGLLKTKRNKVKFSSATKRMELILEDYSDVLITELDEMQVFLSTLFSSQITRINILTYKNQGMGVWPTVETNMGIMTLQSLPINSAVDILGMNSFNDSPVAITNLSISGGHKKYLSIDLHVALKNPSAVTVALGDVYLYVYYKSIKIAIAKFSDMKLTCCNKTVNLIGKSVFSPQTEVVRDRFLSNFVSNYYNESLNIEIFGKGDNMSSKIPILQKTMEKLSLMSVIPTLPELLPYSPSMVLTSRLYKPSLMHLNQLHTALSMRNPFGAMIQVMAINVTLVPCEIVEKDSKHICRKYYSKPLARYELPRMEQKVHIHLPAYTTRCFSCCEGADCQKPDFPLCPDASVGNCPKAKVLEWFSVEAIAALWRTATKGLLIAVNGMIEVRIGNYEAKLMYQQKNLLVVMA